MVYMFCYYLELIFGFCRRIYSVHVNLLASTFKYPKLPKVNENVGLLNNSTARNSCAKLSDPGIKNTHQMQGIKDEVGRQKLRESGFTPHPLLPLLSSRLLYELVVP
eukprot:Rmarinus@m.27914